MWKKYYLKYIPNDRCNRKVFKRLTGHWFLERKGVNLENNSAQGNEYTIITNKKNKRIAQHLIDKHVFEHGLKDGKTSCINKRVFVSEDNVKTLKIKYTSDELKKKMNLKHLREESILMHSDTRTQVQEEDVESENDSLLFEDEEF
jgi:hypothetical protein